MIITTMGTEYWPVTAAGRSLCLFLALYAFAIFGYITATIATLFIGQESNDDESGMAGKKDIVALRHEVGELKALLRELASRSEGSSRPDADGRWDSEPLSKIALDFLRNHNIMAKPG